jgi:hypothetical protein
VVLQFLGHSVERKLFDFAHVDDPAAAAAFANPLNGEFLSFRSYRDRAPTHRIRSNYSAAGRKGNVAPAASHNWQAALLCL